MTKKITFCSMMSVMGILCFIISIFLQTNTIFLYLFSTLFTYISVVEYGIKYGFLTYAVITLVGFMVVGNIVSIGAYAIVVGYYPIIKHIAEHINTNKAVKQIIKIVFAVIVATIAYFIFRQFIVFKLNIALVYAIGIVVFIVYDIMLTMGIKFYALRLRKFK